MSGADLEYAAMLARAGQGQAVRNLDGARLEQLADQGAVGANANDVTIAAILNTVGSATRNALLAIILADPDIVKSSSLVPLPVAGVWRDTFTITINTANGTGGVGGATITLGAIPIANSCRVYRNQALLADTGGAYSLTNNIIRLYSCALGDSITVVYNYSADEVPGAGSIVVTPTAVISDDFTRADSALTPGSADTGQAWVVPLDTAGTQPVAGISTNQLYFPNDQTDGYVYIDSLLADAVVEFKFTALGSSVASNGPVLRFQDAGNCITLNRRGLYIRIAGANGNGIDGSGSPLFYFTGTNNGAVQLFLAGDTIRVVMKGSSLKVYRQVNSVGDFNLVGSGVSDWYKTLTKHGIRQGSGGTGNKYDNFRVYTT